MVSVPPLPAIADVSFTHAVAEVELDPLLLQVATNWAGDAAT